jgi:Tfp pilus assembly protein PilV
MIKKYKKILRNEKGVSLVEVLGSIVIIGIILYTVLSITGFTSLSIIKSDNRTNAVIIAEKELSHALERIKTEEMTETEKNAESFKVYTDITEISENPSFGNSTPRDTSTSVSLQGVGTNNHGEQVLVTITVSWGGANF